MRPDYVGIDKQMMEIPTLHENPKSLMNVYSITHFRY